MKQGILTKDKWPAPELRPMCWEEARQDYKKGECVTSPDDVVSYLNRFISGMPKEVFTAMFLDHRNHMVHAMAEPGTVDHTAVYPREIIKMALDLNATGIILAHNHPG